MRIVRYTESLKWSVNIYLCMRNVVAVIIVVAGNEICRNNGYPKYESYFERQTIYAPRWIRIGCLGLVTRESNSSIKTLTVGSQTKKRPPSSWCSVNVDNYSNNEVWPKLQQSSSLSSELTPSSIKSSVYGLRPMRNPSNSSSARVPTIFCTTMHSLINCTIRA